ANRKMDRAAHFTLSVMIRDRLLDQANAKHLAVQINLPLGVKRPGGGETLTRCGNCVHAEQSRSCEVLIRRCEMVFHARRHPVWPPRVPKERQPRSRRNHPSRKMPQSYRMWFRMSILRFVAETADFAGNAQQNWRGPGRCSAAPPT